MIHSAGNIKKLYLLIIAMFAFSAVACNEDLKVETGSITGNVKFYTHPSADTQIVITDLNSKQKYNLVTDLNGEFEINDIWKSRYRVEATRKGFITQPEYVELDLSDNFKNNSADFEQYVTWEIDDADMISSNPASVLTSASTIVKVLDHKNSAGEVIGHICAGHTPDPVTGKSNYFYQIYDLLGKPLEGKYYANENMIDVLTDFAALPNGDGYVFCGYSITSVSSKNRHNIRIFAINNSGTQIWKNKFLTDTQNDEYAEAIDVKEVSPGKYQYIVCGTLHEYSGETKISDGFIVWLNHEGLMTSANGNIKPDNLVDHLIGGTGWDNFADIAYLKNSNDFFVGGDVESLPDNKINIWLSHYEALAPNGKYSIDGLGWYGVTDPASESRLAGCVTESDDSVVMAVNYTEFAKDKIMLIRFNSGLVPGSLNWLTAYETIETDFAVYAKSITPTKDGGYFLTGYLTSSKSTIYDAVVYRLDNNFSVIWKKVWGTGNYISEVPVSACETYDSGFLIIGTNRDISNNKWSFIKKLDSAGNIPVDYNNK